MLRETRSALLLTDYVFRNPAGDSLDVQLDEDWTRLRTEELGRPFWSFRVHNNDRDHEYEADIFIGAEGEICAYCSCPATIPCKHIYASLVELYYIQPDFALDHIATAFFDEYYRYVGDLDEIVVSCTGRSLSEMRGITI